MDSKIALKQWEALNHVHSLSPQDDIFKYDSAEQKKQVESRPWKNEYGYRAIS